MSETQILSNKHFTFNSANMFEKLRLLVTLEMKVFHKSIYILQDEAMTETVDALIEDGSKLIIIYQCNIYASWVEWIIVLVM